MLIFAKRFKNFVAYSNWSIEGLYNWSTSRPSCSPIKKNKNEYK